MGGEVGGQGYPPGWWQGHPGWGAGLSIRVVAEVMELRTSDPAKSLARVSVLLVLRSAAA